MEAQHSSSSTAASIHVVHNDVVDLRSDAAESDLQRSLDVGNNEFGDCDDEFDNWRSLRFSSADSAREFYFDYAHKEGFSVRIDQQGKRNNVFSYLYYCCSKEGFRDGSKNASATSSKDAVFVKKTKGCRKVKEERTGCKAIIRFRLIRAENVYFISQWVREHNHPLMPSELSHMIKSNRGVNEHQSQVAISHMTAGLNVKSSFRLLSLAAGGKSSVGMLQNDLKNHVRTHKKEKMANGELDVMLKYLNEEARRKPIFFCEMRLDENDLITNIFWADGEMRLDYACFGDVVSFDTTFRTNNTYRPLGAFLGLSHHQQSCIFAVVLLFDQTAETFVWLFETFLKCMNGKRLVSIFTDQDAAMAKALEIVLPETYHGLCTWHIAHNAASNLNIHYTLEFKNEFFYLINDVETEEQFECTWKKMVQTLFGGTEHTWLRYIYRFRKQCCSAWVKSSFTAGLKTSQLSESFNAFLRRYHSIDHNLIEFFHHFGLMLDDMREKLNKAIFDSIRYIPAITFHHSSIIKQVAYLYTPPIFELFQEQYSLAMSYLGILDSSSDCLLRKLVSVYKFAPVIPNLKLDECEVIIDLENTEWSYSCRKFVNFGIIFCHVMKAVDIIGSSGCYPQLRLIPDKYILPRWTRSARGSSSAWGAPDITQPSSYTIRHQEYCTSLMKVADQICLHEDVYLEFMNEVHQCVSRAVEKIHCNYQIAPIHVQDASITGSTGCQESSSFQMIKGLKPRENPNKSRRRLKGVREVAAQRFKSAKKIKEGQDPVVG